SRVEVSIESFIASRSRLVWGRTTIPCLRSVSNCPALPGGRQRTPSRYSPRDFMDFSRQREFEQSTSSCNLSEYELASSGPLRTNPSLYPDRTESREKQRRENQRINESVDFSRALSFPEGERFSGSSRRPNLLGHVAGEVAAVEGEDVECIRVKDQRA